MTFHKNTPSEITKRFTSTYSLKPHIAAVMHFMVSTGLLNLRAIGRYHAVEISLFNKEIWLGKNQKRVSTSQLDALIIIDFLHEIIGNYDNLIDVIEILSNLEYAKLEEENDLALATLSMLLILDNNTLKFSHRISMEGLRTHHIKEKKQRIEYTPLGTSEGYYGRFQSFKDFSTPSSPLNIPLSWDTYFNILLKTLKYLKKKGY